MTPDTHSNPTVQALKQMLAPLRWELAIDAQHAHGAKACKVDLRRDNERVSVYCAPGAVLIELFTLEYHTESSKGRRGIPSRVVEWQFKGRHRFQQLDYALHALCDLVT